MAASDRVLKLRCTCGAWRCDVVDVHPAVANRVACACSGCRSFAARMGHEAMLDEDGATSRFQVSPASLNVTTGSEQVGCIQQTRGGALRWYARCCDTPLGLSLWQMSMPFIALDTARIEVPGDEDAVAQLLGPLRARVNTTLRGPAARARKADLRSLLGMLVHFLPIFVRWWWRRDQWRSPFVDPHTFQPKVEVERSGQ